MIGTNLKQTIKKALPAVTSSMVSGEGLSWVSEMITECAGQCYFDYINLVGRIRSFFLRQLAEHDLIPVSTGTVSSDFTSGCLTMHIQRVFR